METKVPGTKPEPHPRIYRDATDDEKYQPRPQETDKSPQIAKLYRMSLW